MIKTAVKWADILAGMRTVVTTPMPAGEIIPLSRSKSRGDRFEEINEALDKIESAIADAKQERASIQDEAHAVMRAIEEELANQLGMKDEQIKILRDRRHQLNVELASVVERRGIKVEVER